MASEKGRSKLSFVKEWRLVFMRLRKPDKEEFLQVSKIIFLGLAIVAAIAYVIHTIAYIIVVG